MNLTHNIMSNNIILTEDVDMGLCLDIQLKINEIKNYIFSEVDDIKIISPSLLIIDQFKNKIKYLNATTTCTGLDIHKTIKRWVQVSNAYRYNSYNEVIDHLNNNTKVYYFHLLKHDLKNNTYTLYVYEKSNLSNNRQEKINKLLNEDNVD